MQLNDVSMPFDWFCLRALMNARPNNPNTDETSIMMNPKKFCADWKMKSNIDCCCGGCDAITVAVTLFDNGPRPLLSIADTAYEYFPGITDSLNDTRVVVATRAEYTR